MKRNHDHKAYGLGVRRLKSKKTLDVLYPIVGPLNGELVDDGLGRVAKGMVLRGEGVPSPNTFKSLSVADLTNLEKIFVGHEAWTQLPILKTLLASGVNDLGYSKMDLVLATLGDANEPIHSTEDAYFRLHVLSMGFCKPHELSLENLFAHLPTIAWTNMGPMLPEDVANERMRLLVRGEVLDVSHIDKFPYLANYHVPKGVRIAKGSQVRLGAYLGEGTTVMPSGYINFNAAVMGNSMVEGRISAGVVVEEHSDIGGGASVMGTLSGGGKETIRIGKQCLVGANAGTGISLGDGCTIAAGTYITAGTKVFLYDESKTPIDLGGNKTSEPNNVVKAKQLSNRNNLLYLRDSVSGRMVCRPNRKPVELNKMLHQNE